MFTRIIEIEGRLDPIAINITDKEDHEFIDEAIEDLVYGGFHILDDETLDMPGATKGLDLVDGLEALRSGEDI